MAKRRIINTKFWSDGYVSELDPSEKLLFLYFLTNPYTNICGAYEISIRQIALDTGFDKEMVERMIKRFEKDGKITYKAGYVIIKNFIKHQEVNPKVKIGIESEIKNLPDDIKNIVYDSLSYLNSNSNLNTNTKNAEPGSARLIPEVIKLFEEVNPACKKMYGNKTQRKACENLIDEYGFEEVSKVIAFLPRSNKIAFMPTIITPLQLWEKYQALKNGLEKKKGEISSKGRGLA